LLKEEISELRVCSAAKDAYIDSAWKVLVNFAEIVQQQNSATLNQSDFEQLASTQMDWLSKPVPTPTDIEVRNADIVAAVINAQKFGFR